MKVLNLFKSIHLLCFVVCVASTTLWSVIAFRDSAIILFISPYVLFWFYRFFLRSPISISASISFLIISLATNWLAITPEEGRKGGLAALAVIPTLFWAVGVTIAFAGSLTQVIFKPDLPVTKTVAIFIALVIMLNAAWFILAFAAQSIVIVFGAITSLGLLTLILAATSRNKS